MKSIVVMPVKNEDWILEKTLRCLSLWADHIIIADQSSTDRTLEIVKQFEKVTVIHNKATFHSSAVRKLLLDEARRVDAGKNLIFSFDADEIPSAEILDQLETIKATCKEGESIELQWLNLWKSTTDYRDDASMFSNAWMMFGFVDDRKVDYTHTNVINDHTSRVPLATLTKVHRFTTPKVLHYQFSNWGRTLSKQSRYRVVEFIHNNSFFNTIKINHRYYGTRNESNVHLSSIDQKAMTSPYEQHGVTMQEVMDEGLYWMDIEILQNFKKYTPAYFSLLDIWYIPWEEKRLLAVKARIPGIPEEPIADPRRFLTKVYHSYAQKYIDYDSFLYALYKKLHTILLKKSNK